MAKENRNIISEESSFEVESDELTIHDPSLLQINVSSRRGDYLDNRVISSKYYNSFYFSRLSAAYGHLNTTLGITSANSKDGKTHVTANLGVSLARAYTRRMVLVDFILRLPQLHTIFVSH